MKKKLISRREAISGVIAAGALGIASPRSFAIAGSSSSKLNVAFIGIGNYGASNLVELASQNIVAICDVDWREKSQIEVRNTPASEVAAKYPQARKFDDWRQMLDQMHRDIDAVVVCTADHMHAPAALASMELGKHTYCEKPLAHSMHDVRAMMASAQKRPRQATQMGNVGHASEDVRTIVEWVRDGAIGKIEKVDVFQAQAPFLERYQETYASIAHISDAVATPPEVKWDLWLGTAPERRYNPMYLPLRWRNWRDFGTGILGDHGPHFIDPALWALDLGYPEWLEAEVDEGYKGEAAEQMFPAHSKVHYHFGAKGSRAAVDLTWYGYDSPPVPEEWDKSIPWPNGGGILHGSKGKIVYGPVYSSKPQQPKQVWLLPADLDKSYKRPAKTIARPDSHWLEWIDAARNGSQPSSNWQYGGLLTEICLLGDIAIRLYGTRLAFDTKAGSFTNNAAANQMFAAKQRSHWGSAT